MGLWAGTHMQISGEKTFLLVALEVSSIKKFKKPNTHTHPRLPTSKQATS